MAENPRLDDEGKVVAIPAQALPKGWRWDVDWPDEEGQRLRLKARLESPEGQTVREETVSRALVAAYVEGFITAHEATAEVEDAGAPFKPLLSAEFEQLSAERLPAPASPGMLEKYVEYCCQSAALSVLKQAQDALDRTTAAVERGEFPPAVDTNTVQEALAASDAAREYAETCKQAICAAMRRAGAGVDLVDTIALAATNQARWSIAAGEPADDTFGAKFLEEQFDGVRPDPPDYVEFEPAGKAWKTDRELAWEEDERLEAAFWRSVEEPIEQDLVEPTSNDLATQSPNEEL